MNVEIKHIDLRTSTIIFLKLLSLPIVILCFIPCIFLYLTILKGLISPFIMMFAFLLYCIIILSSLYVVLLAIIITYNKLAIKNSGIRIKVTCEE
jgi:hypothetical protein